MKRFYADTYDCRNQKAAISNWHLIRKVDSVDRDSLEYIGRLRLDALLYGTVIIPDGDFFDGKLFMDAAVNNYIDKLPLGRMEFKTRESSFASSLLGTVKNRAGTEVRTTYFDTLPLDHAKSVQDRLRRTKPNKIADWRSILDIFKAENVPAEYVDAYDRGWRTWLDYESRGLVTLSQWSSFDFDEHNLSILRSTGGALREKLAAQPEQIGLSIFDQLSGVLENRGEVVRIIDNVKLDNESQEIQRQIETIKWWHNSAYNKTRLAHHGCTLSELTKPSIAYSYSENWDKFDEIIFSRTPAKNHKEIVLPSDFLVNLGKFASDEMVELEKERFVTRLAAWRNGGPSFESKLKPGLTELVEAVHERYPLGQSDGASSKILSGLKFMLPKVANAATRSWTTVKFGALAGETAGTTVDILTKSALDIITLPIASKMKIVPTAKRITDYARSIVGSNN